MYFVILFWKQKDICCINFISGSEIVPFRALLHVTVIIYIFRLRNNQNDIAAYVCYVFISSV